MTNIHGVVGKAAALAMLPSLTLGIFAAPALAYESAGVTTIITTSNVNSGVVTNNLKVKADTGSNVADGGKGAQGGNSGTSGSSAGNGGAGGTGGNGGDADAEDGYAEGGAAAFGGNGAAGGNTGNTGAAGNGGNGGAGGEINTGNAAAGAAVYNAVNINTTEIELPSDCGCAQYNEYYEAADSFYERHQREMSEKTETEENGHYGHHRRGGEETNTEYNEAESSELADAHWEVYSKEFVPVTTIVTTSSVNAGDAQTNGEVVAETGNNRTDGGKAGKGGTSGNTGSGAGVGGNGGNGGEGGSAVVGGEVEKDYRAYGHHRGNHDEDDAMAIGGTGAEGGSGAEGGDTGNTGAAGNGGNGAAGGVIWTGHANAALELENYVNVENLKISRTVN